MSLTHSTRFTIANYEDQRFSTKKTYLFQEISGKRENQCGTFNSHG